MAQRSRWDGWILSGRPARKGSEAFIGHLPGIGWGDAGEVVLDRPRQHGQERLLDLGCQFVPAGNHRHNGWGPSWARGGRTVGWGDGA
jgi:hypothetical protein